MKFPVDLLADVSQGKLQELAENYMNTLLYMNPDNAVYLSLSDSTKVRIESSSVGFVPLYGTNDKIRILALFSPADPLNAVALYLLDRWWTVNDILKTADRARDGAIVVESIGERIVLYILNRVIYRAKEIDTEEEIPFLCHGERDYAKVFWNNGEAVGFYSVKPSGTSYESYSTRTYQLPVIDSIFVRKHHRCKGFGLQMLEDFVLTFEEDCVGLRYPLTKAMCKVCEKYLCKYPGKTNLLWEVESEGCPNQRSNIFNKIQTMDLRALSKILSFVEQAHGNTEVTETNLVMETVTTQITEAESMECTVEILEEVIAEADVPVAAWTRSSGSKQKKSTEIAEEKSKIDIRIEDIEAESQDNPKSQQQMKYEMYHVSELRNVMKEFLETENVAPTVEESRETKETSEDLNITTCELNRKVENVAVINETEKGPQGDENDVPVVSEHVLDFVNEAKVLNKSNVAPKIEVSDNESKDRPKKQELTPSKILRRRSQRHHKVKGDEGEELSCQDTARRLRGRTIVNSPLLKCRRYSQKLCHKKKELEEVEPTTEVSVDSTVTVFKQAEKRANRKPANKVKTEQLTINHERPSVEEAEWLLGGEENNNFNVKGRNVVAAETQMLLENDEDQEEPPVVSLRGRCRVAPKDTPSKQHKKQQEKYIDGADLKTKHCSIKAASVEQLQECMLVEQGNMFIESKREVPAEGLTALNECEEQRTGKDVVLPLAEGRQVEEDELQIEKKGVTQTVLLLEEEKKVDPVAMVQEPNKDETTSAELQVKNMLFQNPTVIIRDLKTYPYDITTEIPLEKDVTSSLPEEQMSKLEKLIKENEEGREKEEYCNKEAADEVAEKGDCVILPKKLILNNHGDKYSAQCDVEMEKGQLSAELKTMSEGGTMQTAIEEKEYSVELAGADALLREGKSDQPPLKPADSFLLTTCEKEAPSTEDKQKTKESTPPLSDVKRMTIVLVDLKNMYHNIREVTAIGMENPQEEVAGNNGSCEQITNQEGRERLELKEDTYQEEMKRDKTHETILTEIEIEAKSFQEDDEPSGFGKGNLRSCGRTTRSTTSSKVATIPEEETTGLQRRVLTKGQPVDTNKSTEAVIEIPVTDKEKIFNEEGSRVFESAPLEEVEQTTKKEKVSNKEETTGVLQSVWKTDTKFKKENEQNAETRVLRRRSKSVATTLRHKSKRLCKQVQSEEKEKDTGDNEDMNKSQEQKVLEVAEKHIEDSKEQTEIEREDILEPEDDMENKESLAETSLTQQDLLVEEQFTDAKPVTPKVADVPVTESSEATTVSDAPKVPNEEDTVFVEKHQEHHADSNTLTEKGEIKTPDTLDISVLEDCSELKTVLVKTETLINPQAAYPENPTDIEIPVHTTTEVPQISDKEKSPNDEENQVVGTRVLRIAAKATKRKQAESEPRVLRRGRRSVTSTQRHNIQRICKQGQTGEEEEEVMAAHEGIEEVFTREVLEEGEEKIVKNEEEAKTEFEETTEPEDVMEKEEPVSEESLTELETLAKRLADSKTMILELVDMTASEISDTTLASDETKVSNEVETTVVETEILEEEQAADPKTLTENERESAVTLVVSVNEEENVLNEVQTSVAAIQTFKDQLATETFTEEHPDKPVNTVMEVTQTTDKEKVSNASEREERAGSEVEIGKEDPLAKESLTHPETFGEEKTTVFKNSLFYNLEETPVEAKYSQPEGSCFYAEQITGMSETEATLQRKRWKSVLATAEQKSKRLCKQFEKEDYDEKEEEEKLTPGVEDIQVDQAKEELQEPQEKTEKKIWKDVVTRSDETIELEAVEKKEESVAEKSHAEAETLTRKQHTDLIPTFKEVDYSVCDDSEETSISDEANVPYEEEVAVHATRGLRCGGKTVKGTKSQQRESGQEASTFKKFTDKGESTAKRIVIRRGRKSVATCSRHTSKRICRRLKTEDEDEETVAEGEVDEAQSHEEVEVAQGKIKESNEEEAMTESEESSVPEAEIPKEKSVTKESATQVEALENEQSTDLKILTNKYIKLPVHTIMEVIQTIDKEKVQNEEEQSIVQTRVLRRARKTVKVTKNKQEEMEPKANTKATMRGRWSVATTPTPRFKSKRLSNKDQTEQEEEGTDALQDIEVITQKVSIEAEEKPEDNEEEVVTKSGETTKPEDEMEKEEELLIEPTTLADVLADSKTLTPELVDMPMPATENSETTTVSDDAKVSSEAETTVVETEVLENVQVPDSMTLPHSLSQMETDVPFLVPVIEEKLSEEDTAVVDSEALRGEQPHDLKTLTEKEMETLFDVKIPVTEENEVSNEEETPVVETWTLEEQQAGHPEKLTGDHLNTLVHNIPDVTQSTVKEKACSEEETPVVETTVLQSRGEMATATKTVDTVDTETKYFMKGRKLILASPKHKTKRVQNECNADEEEQNENMASHVEMQLHQEEVLEECQETIKIVTQGDSTPDLGKDSVAEESMTQQEILEKTIDSQILSEKASMDESCEESRVTEEKGIFNVEDTLVVETRALVSGGKTVKDTKKQQEKHHQETEEIAVDKAAEKAVIDDTQVSENCTSTLNVESSFPPAWEITQGELAPGSKEGEPLVVSTKLLPADFQYPKEEAHQSIPCCNDSTPKTEVLNADGQRGMQETSFVEYVQQLTGTAEDHVEEKANSVDSVEEHMRKESEEDENESSKHDEGKILRRSHRYRPQCVVDQAKAAAETESQKRRSTRKRPRVNYKESEMDITSDDQEIGMEPRETKLDKMDENIKDILITSETSDTLNSKLCPGEEDDYISEDKKEPAVIGNRILRGRSVPLIIISSCSKSRHSIAQVRSAVESSSEDSAQRRSPSKRKRIEVTPSHRLKRHK